MVEHANFRIAFREDGEFWRAYFTKMESMEGALELASVRITVVRGDPVLQDAFMSFAKGLMERAVLEVLGPKAKITSWNEPQIAPEHERKP